MQTNLKYLFPVDEGGSSCPVDKGSQHPVGRRPASIITQKKQPALTTLVLINADASCLPEPHSRS